MFADFGKEVELLFSKCVEDQRVTRIGNNANALQIAGEDVLEALLTELRTNAAEFLAALLAAAGEAALAGFGAMDLETRQGNLEAFRGRAARVLVVTDVAARGLDIPLLDNVVNYDMPDKAKLFVHRVGRVARGGRAGAAFSLVTAADLPYMLDFLLFLGRPVSNVFMRDAPAPRVSRAA